MTDNEMVEKYTEVSVNEYKDSLVDIDDIDILREAIAEAYLAGAEFGYNKCKEELNQKGLALQSDMDKIIEQNIALKKELLDS